MQQVSVTFKGFVQKLTFLTIISALALSFSVFGNTLKAEAASTYIKNTRSWSAPACGAIGCPYGPGLLVNNGTGFSMRCWQDGAWRQSNGVWSNRWFKGYISGRSGYYWVPAPYVYNQIVVGRC